MRILNLASAALALAMLASPIATVGVQAAPSETCFTKALNGDVIDPPMCVTAIASTGGTGGGMSPMPTKKCTKTDETACSY